MKLSALWVRGSTDPWEMSGMKVNIQSYKGNGIGGAHAATKLHFSIGMRFIHKVLICVRSRLQMAKKLFFIKSIIVSWRNVKSQRSKGKKATLKKEASTYLLVSLLLFPLFRLALNLRHFLPSYSLPLPYSRHFDDYCHFHHMAWHKHYHQL